MSARDEVLARVRSALGDAPAVPDVPRDYHGAGAAAADVDLFCERVADYKAKVHRVAAGEVGAVAAQVLAAHGAERVAGTLDLGIEWAPDDRRWARASSTRSTAWSPAARSGSPRPGRSCSTAATAQAAAR